MDIDELIMAFEDEFGCRIPDRDAADLHTVGDAIAYLGQISRRGSE
jgi:acyl carrier protein